ncbi:MAG: glycerophosphodiester phosphodiesterase [Parcubacteria group bacterium]|nr:glycerophosphodiester phosphodiesterase [Parcubacteria group bacterium]
MLQEYGRRTIMIISHRGYAKEHPENTFAAFDAAFAAGADAIETDVRIAGDGVMVVSHDPVKSSEGLISLDELFEYIAQKGNASFFLELKTSSPDLLGAILKHIDRLGAWERVHLIGFSHNLTTAVRSQKDFPQLNVDQILKLPSWAYLKKIRPSHAVYIGWLDAVPGSESAFKWLVPHGRLRKLKERFESQGFKVYGGVLNREDGIRYFQSAGISDIVTDEVVIAVTCQKLLLPS